MNLNRSACQMNNRLDIGSYFIHCWVNTCMIFMLDGLNQSLAVELC